LAIALRRFGGWAALACFAWILLGCTERRSEAFVTTDISGGAYAGVYRLADQHGKVRSQEDFKGKVVLLFFGYTHCPDVCLTLLSQLALVMDGLGDDAKRVQVVFVTLDPERDTADRLAGFVGYFHPDFLALRGDGASIAKTAQAFKVSYSKHDSGSAAGYLLDHSAGIYVFDTRGRLRLLMNYGTELTAMVHDVKLLLGEKP
jgi:protein SCO1/2